MPSILKGAITEYRRSGWERQRTWQAPLFMASPVASLSLVLDGGLIL